MNLVVDTELPRAARWALEKLMRALGTRGESVEVTTALGPDLDFIIGLAGQSSAVEDAFTCAGVRCPDASESLVLHPLAAGGFLICGRDERGLMYALLEAARAVDLPHRRSGTASSHRGVAAFGQPLDLLARALRRS